MIIIGYPGIGKSNLALEQNNVIDLDSSFFKDSDGARFEGWEEIYVNIAIELSNQGNDVFISAHKEVRNWLLWRRQNSERFKIGLIYPCKALKKKWVKRISTRDADSAALDRVEGFMDSDIAALDIINGMFDCVYVIRDMNYDLCDVLYDFRRKACEL